MIRPSLAVVLAAALVGSAGLAARANGAHHRNFDVSQISTDPSLIVNAQADDENDVDDVSDSSQVDQNDQAVVEQVNQPVFAGNESSGDAETNDDAVATPVYGPPAQYQNNADEQAGQSDEEDQNQSDDQENDSEGD